MPTLSVEWGNDLHRCELNDAQWAMIHAGQKVTVVRPYRYEGVEHTGIWRFNHTGPQSLQVTDNDDGDCFIGQVADGWVDEA